MTDFQIVQTINFLLNVKRNLKHQYLQSGGKQKLNGSDIRRVTHQQDQTVTISSCQAVSLRKSSHRLCKK